MRIRSQLLIRIAGCILTAAIRMLFWTLRLEVHSASRTSPYDATVSERYLYSVWHDSMIIAAFGGPHARMVALTSRHQDGSLVASVMRWLRVKPVRGSTGHGGGQALREMIAAARDNHIVITPDGPRGPRRTMSTGMIFLASRTGNAIVPTAFLSVNAWTIRGSWTDMVVPKPFSRVFLLAGSPISVPPQISRAEIDHYVTYVQAQMDQLHRDAQQLISVECAEQPGTAASSAA